MTQTSGVQATNHPPNGEERVLDEMLLSPNLAVHYEGGGAERILGFSSHSMLYCDMKENPDSMMVSSVDAAISA